jgi:hypothetical protein
MRTAIMFAALLLLHAPTASAQAAQSAPNHPTSHEKETSTIQPVPAHLVGDWKSTPDRIALTSAFDESVWGKNATSVRMVDLRVLPTGHATLTVTRKVENAKGAAVPGSTSIEHADLVIGAAKDPVASRVEYETTVSKAERRYPDSPGSTWNLDGLRVTVSTLQGEENKSVEIRFDTPEGRGSFWDTLHRGAAAARPATRPAKG